MVYTRVELSLQERLLSVRSRFGPAPSVDVFTCTERWDSGCGLSGVVISFAAGRWFRGGT
jgi:hypothetical protein